MPLDRARIVAILTGVMAILLGVAYLLLVQLLDYRPLLPAPEALVFLPLR